MKKFYFAISTYFFMKNYPLADCTTNYGPSYIYFVYFIVVYHTRSLFRRYYYNRILIITHMSHK